ncbi:MAG TPA: lipoyl domain-containing protein [Actinomycetes bacterium]
MSVEITFPALGKDPDQQGVVATWLVRDGEPVTAGQVIAEVAVDKVSVDVEAPTAGTVRLLVPEEGVATPGTVIARIE